MDQGSERGPVALPVFKIGRSLLTRGGWVRLPGASAIQWEWCHRRATGTVPRGEKWRLTSTTPPTQALPKRSCVLAAAIRFQTSTGKTPGIRLCVGTAGRSSSSARSQLTSRPITRAPRVGAGNARRHGDPRAPHRRRCARAPPLRSCPSPPQSRARRPLSRRQRRAACPRPRRPRRV